MSDKEKMMALINEIKADVVSRKAYEQVKWERDAAIEQLKSYGVSLFEDADVVKVVRCKDCIHYKDEWCEILKAETPIADGFCCYGERKCE